MATRSTKVDATSPEPDVTTTTEPEPDASQVVESADAPSESAQLDALKALASRDDVMEVLEPEATAVTVAPEVSADVMEAGGTVEVTLTRAANLPVKMGDTYSYLAAAPGQRVKVSKEEADRLKALGSAEA